MVVRQNWATHVNRILRSGHYTWIGDGLAGHKVEHALTRILVDAMHMCRRENLDWDSVLADSMCQFLEEEEQAAGADS
jgi:hypothetical protein